MSKPIQLVTMYGLWAICLQSFVARLAAGEYRVVATRHAETDQEIEYRLIRDTESGDPTCFWIYDTHDETDIFSVKPVCQATIFKNGGWRVIRESMKSRNVVWDENGDGLFDALFDPVGKIRFGNDLIKIYGSKRAPWNGAEEMSAQRSGRRFVFIGNQWQVLSSESNENQEANAPLSQSVYTVPSGCLPRLQPQGSSRDFVQKLDTLKWREPDFFVWSECEFVPLASERIRFDSGLTEIRFHTLKNVSVRVILNSLGVTRWEFGHLYSQEFAHDGQNGADRSKFIAGPFHYIDRDGDRRFDTFLNSNTNELIEMGPTSLARLELPERHNKIGFPARQLLFPGVAIVVSIFGYFVLRRIRRRIALKHRMRTTDGSE